MRNNPFTAPKVFNIKRRMNVALLFVLVIPLIIIGRLFYMQTFLHQEFTSKAEKAIYDYIDEDRLRGKIYDVQGRSLAESVRTHSLGINKRYVQDKDKTLEFVAKTLGNKMSVYQPV